MKKVEVNKYTHSVTLFKFCKQALSIRYDGNVKVIDQDVGAILGYDPADCSHWKKGKKNIKTLNTFKSIAKYLNIDERLLIDVASGKVALEEAVFEFKGYGDFSLTGQNIDTLKKKFFNNPTHWQKERTNKNFDEIININRPTILKLTEEILEINNIKENPIYMTEILQNFENFKLTITPEQTEDIRVKTINLDTTPETLITMREQDMRPYKRFIIAKELFKHLILTKNAIASEFFDSPLEMIEIQANIFAEMLLIPGKMLKREVNDIKHSLDVVTQLAKTFWVSKTLMNHRLRDYMTNLN